MVLNYIWIFFFLCAFVVALYRTVVFGEATVFADMVTSTFNMSKTGFEIALGLTGMLTLWMGILKIGELGGAVNVLAKAINPFFRRLFPSLKADSPAYGSIMMNLSANMLGLDNAATPIGLRAMKQMHEENACQDEASDAQIMFLVLNTSGLTIVPVSIMVYRAQCGAADPTDIFIPILLATYFSTIAGLIAVAAYQRLNLFNRVVMAYLGGLTALIVFLIWYLSGLPQEQIAHYSGITANALLFSIMVGFIGMAFYNKINVYEAFIEGAKDGFSVAIKIIPYLIAILVAVGVFRASGAMDLLMNGVRYVVSAFGANTDFVDALPTALMKPLSGSGARGLMIDTMNQHGADSFAGRLASSVQGVTDTTLYIIAVYFGAVNIRRTRYAVSCGLIADAAGIIAAIGMAYLFFK
ncbi:MAG: nucleoside recognition domain-containing protein [Marinifilaceae bacterium]